MNTTSQPLLDTDSLFVYLCAVRHIARKGLWEFVKVTGNEVIRCCYFCATDLSPCTTQRNGNGVGTISVSSCTNSGSRSRKVRSKYLYISTMIYEQSEITVRMEANNTSYETELHDFKHFALEDITIPEGEIDPYNHLGVCILHPLSARAP